MENKIDKRNKYFFGLGTIGRDMFYTLESMFLIVFLTEVVKLEDKTFLILTYVLTGLRIFDAFNDPIMGLVVDNTKSRWGKFKPGIFVGAIGGSVFMILLFTDFGLKGAAYPIVFGLCYLGWDILYGVNDIAYWSMMPSLTTNQKERERIGAFARICANIGLFTVVVGLIPITNLMTEAIGDAKKAWFVFTVAICIIMLGFLCFTLFGVKEQTAFKEENKTSFREMFSVLFKNDQLMWTAVAMALFMIGYMTTADFGVYFFTYAYGDGNMYSIFALVLGVSQLSAMLVFPLFRRKFSRKKLYTGATAAIALGYIGFFFAPMNMLAIGVCGILIFIGEAFIQILMLMFLADSIEYGQWKLGKRNESITFSVQPFINKIGAALANGIVGVTLVISGINAANSAADVPDGGIMTMKTSMMILPLVVIIAGYLIYLTKYKIDEKFYDKIVNDLKERGDIKKS